MSIRRSRSKGQYSVAKRLPIAPILILITVFSCGLPYSAASASERVKRPPPAAAEAERLASEMAMSDGMLQKGDIVVSDRGFLLYRGLAPDGVTGDFVAIPNPWSPQKAKSALGK